VGSIKPMPISLIVTMKRRPHARGIPSFMHQVNALRLGACAAHRFAYAAACNVSSFQILRRCFCGQKSFVSTRLRWQMKKASKHT
jgi:hypothetical protein